MIAVRMRHTVGWGCLCGEEATQPEFEEGETLIIMLPA